MRDGRTWVAAVLVAALGFHLVAFLGYAPGDVYFFNREWFRQLAAHGMAQPVGNYAPPYLYLLWFMTLFDGLLWQVVLIKLLSVIGALWMAFAASRLLDALRAPPSRAILILALPSVILDASLLGQADAFWIAPCLLATTAALRGKYDRVAFWSGLAFAVKAQAAFFAPFVIYLFLHRRVPWRTWLLAPVAVVVAWTPAWLAGWPPSYLATIYLGQAEWVNSAGNFFIGSGATWWSPFGYFVPATAYELRWIGFPIILVGLAAYWWWMPPPDDADVTLIAAIIGAAGVPFLLPLMLDRFFLLATVLSFILATARPNIRTIILAALVEVSCAYPMLVWAFRLQPTEVLAAPVLLVALIGYLQIIRRHRTRTLESHAKGLRVHAAL